MEEEIEREIEGRRRAGEGGKERGGRRRWLEGKGVLGRRGLYMLVFFFLPG